MLLRTCLALLIAVGAWAQQARPAEPPAKRDDTLTRDSFSALPFLGVHSPDCLGFAGHSYLTLSKEVVNVARSDFEITFFREFRRRISSIRSAYGSRRERGGCDGRLLENGFVVLPHLDRPSVCHCNQPLNKHRITSNGAARSRSLRNLSRQA